MSTEPVISIVIPCYRGAKFLGAAIESCLAQSRRDLEVIVVDDASPDDCLQIAESYTARDERVRIVKHPRNRGVSAAFNSGFAVSRGNYMTRLAQDDVFSENAVEMMAGALASAPEVGVVYADETLMDGEGMIVGERKKAEPATVFQSPSGPGMCFMWRRKVWETVGGFRAEFDTAEDYDFMQRAMAAFPARHLPVSLLTLRLHSDMGSRVHSIRQGLLAEYVKSRFVTGRVQARRFLAAACFDAAYNYREQGRWLSSLRHLQKSILLWPLQWNAYKGLLTLAARITISAISRKQPVGGAEKLV